MGLVRGRCAVVRVGVSLMDAEVDRLNTQHNTYYYESLVDLGWYKTLKYAEVPVYIYQRD